MAAIGVLVLGNSGTGKSASLRNFNPDDISLINVSGKRLPFPGGKDFKRTVVTDDAVTIIKLLKSTKSKVVVIDDSQYIMANEFMRRSSEKGFEKFNLIGRHFWDIIQTLSSLPDDLVVYFLHHLDTDDNGCMKAKTQGRMIDSHICLEGLFGIVLRTVVQNGHYGFFTQNQGNDTTKTPIGMFKDIVIENDLAKVDAAIRQYYGIANK